MKQELMNRFEYHAPTKEAKILHEVVRGAAVAAAKVLNEFLPEGRDKALALTHLESAMYSANAAIARNHDALPELVSKM